MWRWAIRAVLVLILLALVIMRFRPKQPSYGFFVHLDTKECERRDAGFYNRIIVLRVLPGGRTFINLDEIPEDSIADRLAEIYGARKDRSIYFLPEEDVSVQEIITLLDKLEGKRLEMSFILLTPGIQDRCGSPKFPMLK
jgi:biopolymer transport protein ExbD